MPQVPATNEKKWTYADYRRCSGDENWEILDGIVYDMSAAPGIKHQDIAGNFYIALKSHSGNRCYTGIAPMDIVLDASHVVQPDVLVVCDRSKITPENIQGAPDLIVEVVSPSTEVKDRREKRRIYERFGVREYIIAFPERGYLERYYLDGDYRGPDIFKGDERLRLICLGIEIDLRQIFGEENPDEADADSPAD